MYFVRSSLPAKKNTCKAFPLWSPPIEKSGIFANDRNAVSSQKEKYKPFRQCPSSIPSKGRRPRGESLTMSLRTKKVVLRPEQFARDDHGFWNRDVFWETKKTLREDASVKIAFLLSRADAEVCPYAGQNGQRKHVLTVHNAADY